MWLPQNPYLVTGNLRDQVTYPIRMKTDTTLDKLVFKCLSRVGLDRLASGPSGLNLIHPEWNNRVSGGERQRIGFARLHFHKPGFAVLDEATSAINPEQDELVDREQ